MRHFIGFALVLALVTSPRSLLAQGPDSLTGSSDAPELASQDDAQRRLAELEAAYRRANVRKPRAGVAVSSILITGGVAILLTGLVLHHGIFAQPTEREQRIGSGVMAAGSITIGAGIGGLVFSGVRLKRAKRERRSLEPEIERLRYGLDSASE